MEEQANQNNKTGSSKVGLAIVGIIVIAFIGIFAYQSQTMTQNTTTSPQSSPATTSESSGTSELTDEETPSQDAQEGTYKDGEYTAVGNYTSPGGEEELGVTLTVASGVVTDAVVEVKATRPISKARQEDFAANYKDMVIGKEIDSISLGKVSGSSLTPKGFNDAVTKVKAEAQS